MFSLCLGWHSRGRKGNWHLWACGMPDPESVPANVCVSTWGFLLSGHGNAKQTPAAFAVHRVLSWSGDRIGFSQKQAFWEFGYINLPICVFQIWGLACWEKVSVFYRNTLALRNDSFFPEAQGDITDQSTQLWNLNLQLESLVFCRMVNWPPCVFRTDILRSGQSPGITSSHRTPMFILNNVKHTEKITIIEWTTVCPPPRFRNCSHFATFTLSLYALFWLSHLKVRCSQHRTHHVTSKNCSWVS